MTSDVNYTDFFFFSFLTGVIKNFSACLSKFGVFIRNWPACFEKASFLYAGSHCIETLLTEVQLASQRGLKRNRPRAKQTYVLNCGLLSFRD